MDQFISIIIFSSLILGDFCHANVIYNDPYIAEEISPQLYQDDDQMNYYQYFNPFKRINKRHIQDNFYDLDYGDPFHLSYSPKSTKVKMSKRQRRIF